jgi:nucleotide-binding universal stress UspA family protein
MMHRERPHVAGVSADGIDLVRGPLVVGVDGSDASLFGLREAASMAQATRAALIVVFVRLPPYQTWTTMTSFGTCSMIDIADSTEIVVEAECIALLGSANLNWQLEIRCGEPAGALMAVAKEYQSDTIVVAGRRHRTVGSIAHGAIAAKLLHRWPGTLVVLHPPPAAQSGSSIDLRAQS